jgi:drug/metabolite transporter (DMT)-like permease
LTAAPHGLAANRRGIACMSAGMVCFVVNDMLMKKLGESVPLAQLIVLRGIVAVLLVLAAARASGELREWPLIADRRVVLRSFVDAAGSLLFLASLMHLPLANATAINLSAPLAMALVAVCFLGERPGLARWLAIGAGFAGVLLIVQPSASGFSVWAWVCLASTLFHVARDLLTRRIGRAVPALLVTLANALAVMLAALVWMSASGWQPMSARELALGAVAAVMLASAYWLVVLATRASELSVVGPFRYTGLLVALVLGATVWGEWPNPLAAGGIVLVLAAGTWLLHETGSFASTARTKNAAPSGSARSSKS